MNTAGSLGLVFAIHLGGELQPRLTTGHQRRADKIKSPEVVLGSFVSASSSL